MKPTEQLIALAQAFCADLDWPLSRASKLIFADARVLGRLVEGSATINLNRADHATQWFSDHWPDSAVWPVGVPRPVSSLPSVPERRASQPNTDHPRGSEGSCPEADSPASGPFIPEALAEAVS